MSDVKNKLLKGEIPEQNERAIISKEVKLGKKSGFGAKMAFEVQNTGIAQILQATEENKETEGQTRFRLVMRGGQDFNICILNFYLLLNNAGLR